MIKKSLIIAFLFLFSLVPPTYGSSDRLLNAQLTTNSSESYTGFVNDRYPSDNGTRIYLLPKDRVSSGVGGALKIFGDAYHKGQSYRDLGIYFHQDQNGDKGTYGTGVFWINSKVAGSPYTGKYPDIGLSFQDGQFVVGRASVVNESPVFVFGKQTSTLAKLSKDIRVEMQGNIALRNRDYLLWNTADGKRFIGLGADEQNRFKFSSIGGTAFYTNGVLQMETTTKSTSIKNALVTSSIKSIKDNGTVDATGANRIKLMESGKVSAINGEDGQKITILFKNKDATVLHNNTIKLQNAEPFTGGMDSTLVLENIEGIWYELSRSINN